MFANAMQAKFASMMLIGPGSFIIGIAPACFVSHVEHLQRKLLLSCALCFGAGVLMSTSTLHVLPETREGLPNHAELVFSCGFLVLYLVDECVYYFCRSCDHASETRDPRRGTSGQNSSYGYNATCTGDGKACTLENDLRLPSSYQQNPLANSPNNNWTFNNYGAIRHTHNFAGEETTFLCHGNHNEQCGDAKTGLVGLSLALTVHAVLEGLAIGLQTQIAEVLLLTGAVASHKFVVGFCLGLELAGVSKSIPKLILAIFLFASGSVVGIGIGMLTFRMHTDWSKMALPILQGLAGGTLLYVTVSEVLPRERARWHKNPRRYAGILQYVSVVGGFVVIFLLNNYVST